MENNKPPLGVPPYTVATPLRMKDLIEAMHRQVEADRMDLNRLTIWAKELICQCELLDKMEGGSNE